MTTRKGYDSAARRTGTARSAQASKNVKLRNASFMEASGMRSHDITGQFPGCNPEAGAAVRPRRYVGLNAHLLGKKPEPASESGRYRTNSRAIVGIRVSA